ncbi:MAG: DUF2975 domain-containing protein [Nocardioides sp.]
MNVKNPLAALELVVSAAGVLMIVGLVAMAFGTLTGSGSGVGLGDSIVCVDAPYGALASHSGGGGVGGAHVTDLATEVHANPSEISLCRLEPSTRQRVLATLVNISEFLFALGFLVLTWRLIRNTRRRGLFVPEVAAALGRLSVYLFFGEFAVTFIQALATQQLVSSMLTNSRDSYFGVYALSHFSWVVIIAAFGLQAMGRVMAMTVPMREEIDATV